MKLAWSEPYLTVPVITIDGVEHHMGGRIHNIGLIGLNGATINLVPWMHHV